MKYRFTTGIFMPKRKKMPFMTVMMCVESTCEYIWQSSCVSNPCPKCGSRNAMPMAKWSPARDGMPVLGMGKVPVQND